MATSYIVVTGEYSDYHVCGVYSTRKKANYAAKVYDGAVIEYEIDELPDHPKGLLGYRVEMKKDGAADVQRCGIGPMEIYLAGSFLNDYSRKDDGQLVIVKEFVISVWAKDEQHAVKIVNEKRAQIIAANEWPDDPPPDPKPAVFVSTSFSPPDDPNPISSPIVTFLVGQ